MLQVPKAVAEFCAGRHTSEVRCPALPLDWSIVMRTSFNHVTNRTIGCFVAFLLLVWPHTASAITYMSIETVPNKDVVGGEDVVVTIRSIGYANLERWSQRLLDQCRVVDSVIDALTANAAISSVTSTNRRVVVAAGGFEGGTNPSFVFTVKDSGAGSVTEGSSRAVWLHSAERFMNRAGVKPLIVTISAEDRDLFDL